MAVRLLGRVCSYRANWKLLGLMTFSMASLVFFLYIPYLYGHSHHHRHHHHRDMDELSKYLQSIPQSMTRAAKCPACFGIDLCDEVREGNLMINVPFKRTEANAKGVYYGRWMEARSKPQGIDVVVKTLEAEEGEFRNFDTFLCQNTSKSDQCDIPKAIRNSFMVKASAWEPENLKQAHKIAHKKPSDLSYTVCSSDLLLQSLQHIDDIDQDGTLSVEEAAMFYTSLVINPEAVLLNFLSSLGIFQVPWFIGSCGRAVVVKSGGLPLGSYLDAPWQIRAALSFHILNMIEHFMMLHRTWAVLFTDFSMDNLAATVDDQGVDLVVIDLEDIIVIEKNDQFDREMRGVETNQTCNENCFRQFFQDLHNISNVNQPGVCIKAGTLGLNAMFSLACRNILSDLEEHKDTINPRSEGLLHNMPQKVAQTLTHSLRECVHESTGGGRVKAVQQILEVLNPHSTTQNNAANGWKDLILE